MNATPMPFISRRRLGALSAFAFLATQALQAAPAFPEADVAAFTDRYCSSCHNDVDKEGGFDLSALKFTPGDPANFLTWVKMHDRVQAGEMPPKEKKRPDAGEMAVFVKQVASSLVASEQEMVAREGRAMRRRLNSYEYENALRDLLRAPWLQVKDQLPEDGEASWDLAGDYFRKVAIDGSAADGFSVTPTPGPDPRRVPHPLASFRQAIRITGRWREVPEKMYIYASGWAETP